MRRHWQSLVPALPSDAAMALLAFALAYWVRFHVYPKYIPGGEEPSPERYVLAAPVVAITLVIVFMFMDVYRLQRGTQFVDELFSVLKAMAVAAGTMSLKNVMALLVSANTFTLQKLTRK